MVTKTRAPRAKAAAPSRRTAAAADAPPAPAPEKPNLLRAGLQALDKARHDVAERQSRVFEAILGLEPTAALGGRDSAAAKIAGEALGLRKFEAVFDQRVANALERMGMPPAEALAALADELAARAGEVAALAGEVAALKNEVRSLKAAARRR